MNKKYREILGWFEQNVPVAQSELRFYSAFQLTIAVILSAQCTDKRVNMVTPALFERFKTPEELAAASFEEVYGYIKSVSFPNNKTKHLIGMAQMLVNDFNSDIPSDIEQLQRLPGVGRKTANVVASIIYDKPVIAVDTHVFRVSKRLGLSHGKNVLEVEQDLTKGIPVEQRAKAHHWLLLHGRYICTAGKPKCDLCGVAPYCDFYSKNINKSDN
ncbi:MAG: endonuclease III [Bacteroidales bacterium]|nr:endonuclease III [Bacteroidales bacterium]MDD4670466.1 endonuclease III [Bacteroidales bacterium]